VIVAHAPSFVNIVNIVNTGIMAGAIIAPIAS
jgi:hypothetical protein